MAERFGEVGGVVGCVLEDDDDEVEPEGELIEDTDGFMLKEIDS